MSFARRLAVVVLLGVGLVLSAATAAVAHVTVNPDSAKPGSYAQLTFRAPNEMASARFTKLVVHFPAAQPLGSVSVRALPGWSVSTTESPLAKPITTDDGTTTKYTSQVTWTATGDGAVGPDQYQNFDVSVGPLPQGGQLMFTADQFYSDGSVVHWNEPTPAAGPEPEHPAPVLTVTAAAAPSPNASRHTSDGLARGLGVAGLIVATFALVAVLTLALMTLLLSAARRRHGERENS